MKITFLGAGAYGRALSHLAEENQHDVKFYDPIVYPKVSLESAIAEAEIIVYVAPAMAAGDILPKLPRDIPLVLSSKGFVSLRHFVGFEKFSVVGGAAFSEDIEACLNGVHGLIKLTTSAPVVERLFGADFIEFEYTHDDYGIMLCGALKNVYAIGAGIFMDEDDPVLKERYLMQCYYEMKGLLQSNGCNPDTVDLACGMDDLILSCTMDSRNFRFGDEIRDYPKSKIEPAGTVEGVTVITTLKKYPEFRAPKEAELFHEIKKKVKYAVE